MERWSAPQLSKVFKKRYYYDINKPNNDKNHA